MTADLYIQVLRLDNESSGALGQQLNEYIEHDHVFAELVSEQLNEKEYTATEQTVYAIASGHDILRTDRLRDTETNDTYDILSITRIDNNTDHYTCKRITI